MNTKIKERYPSDILDELESKGEGLVIDVSTMIQFNRLTPKRLSKSCCIIFVSISSGLLKKKPSKAHVYGYKDYSIKFKGTGTMCCPSSVI